MTPTPLWTTNKSVEIFSREFGFYTSGAYI